MCLDSKVSVHVPVFCTELLYTFVVQIILIVKTLFYFNFSNIWSFVIVFECLLGHHQVSTGQWPAPGFNLFLSVCLCSVANSLAFSCVLAVSTRSLYTSHNTFLTDSRDIQNRLFFIANIPVLMYVNSETCVFLLQ